MSLFGSFGIAGSGLHVMRTWLDAVGDNIANMNDATATNAPAFQARMVHASSTGHPGDGGVKVDAILLGDPKGRLVYDPSHPLADADGMVRYPDVDLGDQMAQLIVAQRGYQANLSVIERARDAYQQALQIGAS